MDVTYESLVGLVQGGCLDVSGNHLGRGLALLHFYDSVIIPDILTSCKLFSC
jgi:hypothetical protein